MIIIRVAFYVNKTKFKTFDKNERIVEEKKTSPRVSRGKPNNRLKRCNFILFALFINFDSKLAANRVSNCEYKSGARQKKKQNNNKIPNIAKIFFVLVLIAMLKVYGVSFSLSRSAHTLPNGNVSCLSL